MPRLWVKQLAGVTAGVQRLELNVVPADIKGLADAMHVKLMP